ncbi:Putative multidrug resistance protein MdtD [Streptomyces microflavus]
MRDGANRGKLTPWLLPPRPGRSGSPRPSGAGWLLTTVLGSGMAMLDSTVINVALPRIGEDLDTDLAALQWTVNAYMLTLAGLILLGGALGDRYGRRRVLVAGDRVVRAGLAPLRDRAERGGLPAARALQGVGGALLTPGSLALIQASFHPDDRARAVGLCAGFGGVGAAVGPFVGGWLVDGPGWRWVFLLNLPLAAICVPVALRHVPESRDPAAHGRFDILVPHRGAGGWSSCSATSPPPCWSRTGAPPASTRRAGRRSGAGEPSAVRRDPRPAFVRRGPPRASCPAAAQPRAGAGT